MAPNYLFKVSITGNISGGKLVRVIYDQDQSLDGYAMPAEVVDVFGGTVLSAGVGKRTYKFTALVQYTAAASGYATFQNVKEWFSIETVQGCKLVVQDMEDSTVYDMVLANKGNFAPVAVSFDRYASGAWWRIPIELKQQ